MTPRHTRLAIVAACRKHDERQLAEIGTRAPEPWAVDRGSAA